METGNYGIVVGFPGFPECSCDKFERNTEELIRAINIAEGEGCTFDFDPILYCPWCGEKLKFKSPLQPTQETEDGE